MLCWQQWECKFGAMHALIPVAKPDRMVVDGHWEMGIMPCMATCQSDSIVLEHIDHNAVAIDKHSIKHHVHVCTCVHHHPASRVIAATWMLHAVLGTMA